MTMGTWGPLGWLILEHPVFRCARPRNPTEPVTGGTGRQQLPYRTQAAGGGGKSSSSGGSRLGVLVPVMPVDARAWKEVGGDHVLGVL